MRTQGQKVSSAIGAGAPITEHSSVPRRCRRGAVGAGGARAGRARAGVVAIGAVASLALAGCSGGGGEREAAAAPASRADALPQSSGGARDGAGDFSSRSPAADAPRVIFLGTSLTAGLGLDPAQAYPSLLQRKADSAGYAVRIVNAGLSGETSAGAVRRAGWVLDQPAALVVLEVGANDGLRGVDPDSTEANLVRLVEIVRRQRPEAQVALMQMEAPTNLGARYTTRFHAAFQRAASAARVPLWPFLLQGVAGDARFNQADGIHPNVTGAERVAATVWRSLEPVLASMQAERRK